MVDGSGCDSGGLGGGCIGGGVGMWIGVFGRDPGGLGGRIEGSGPVVVSAGRVACLLDEILGSTGWRGFLFLSLSRQVMQVANTLPCGS
jgi:hypothetical protein